MISQWLSWVNCAILGSALLFGLAGGLFWLKRPAEIVCTNPILKECGLPKSSFELPEQAYNQAGTTILALQQEPFAMQLPNLKSQLIYYGKNGRPDAQTQNTLLHFSFNGNKAVTSIEPGGKLFLIYDRKSNPGRYSFSPNNEKSSLWIKANPFDKEVEVKVKLENDKGEKITEPKEFAEFRLSEKEFSRHAGVTWEIGSFRVDGTLLARQRARWFGPDKFLEQHGGDEFHENVGKHRIEFGENDDLYSVFVKADDCLIWTDNSWKVVPPGEKSLGFPLLVVKKIDERLMAFELWDVEGKGKILLNLLKSTEPWGAQNTQSLQNMFKFVGARTRTQCVFEINRERMVLRPSDWLLLTPKGWKKLETVEEIDNYVKRKLTGSLFVFEGISRKDEQQIMKGTLYSPARHDSLPIELALQVKKPKSAGEKETKENDRPVEKGPIKREEEQLNKPQAPAAPIEKKSK